MAFSTDIKSNNTIVLYDNSTGCTAEIYLFGALLNSFSIPVNNEPVNVVDAFSSPEDAAANITNGFKSAKLNPFVCRLEKGKYSFEGNDYKIDKFYMGDEAIHGLIYNAPYKVKSYGEDDEKAFVTLQYSYASKTEGFPFAYSVDVTYSLRAGNTLTLFTAVTNTGTTDMPLSDGWHPYFKLGDTVNDLTVQFNSDTMMEFDERLLPSGKSIPDNRFEQPMAFGDTFLDNCFLLKDHNHASCVLTDSKKGVRFSITADKSYPYLQVYTPPHRKSIAIENLSSVPDAFNNGIGLIKAAPDTTHAFKTTYKLEIL